MGFNRSSFSSSVSPVTLSTKPKSSSALPPLMGWELSNREYRLEAPCNGILIESFELSNHEPWTVGACIKLDQVVAVLREGSLLWVIKSPVKGVITKVNYQLHQKVTRGECLLMLRPLPR